MAGTKTGGEKARQTLRERYGADYFANIGRKGGENGHTGGFASEIKGSDGLTGLERAKKWGAIGGKISKRGKARNERRVGLSAGYIAGRKSKGSQE